MSVKLTMSKGVASVLISAEVQDLLDLVGQTEEVIRQRILERLKETLSNAAEAEQYTDAALDYQVAEAAARVAKLKAARPELVDAIEIAEPMK